MLFRSIGIAAPSAVLNPAAPTQTDNTKSALFVSDSVTTTKGIAIGYDASGDFAHIQSVNKGVAYKNVYLQPEGGSVGVGTTNAPSKFYVSGNAAQNISALTDGATITPDFSVANNFSVTLGGNRTLANPTNITAGQSGVIFVTQDGTGSRTLAYGTYWDFPNQSAPSLTTTANAVDVLVWTARTTTSIVVQILPNIGP